MAISAEGLALAPWLTVTPRSSGRQRRQQRARDARRRRDPRTATRPRDRRSAWLGVLAQPVGVLVILIANGMLVDPEPPPTEWPMLLPIGVLAVLGLLPVLVQRARSGGLGEIALGLVTWGFAQSGIGLVAALLVRVLAGQEWMLVAMFSVLAGILAAAALMVLALLWAAGMMLALPVREWRVAHGLDRWVRVLLSAGLGGALLGSLALGLGVAAVDGAPDPRRGLVSLTGVLTWSFATEEAGAGVWAARVGAVLVMGGLLMVLGGIVMLLRGSRRQRAAR